MTRLVPLHSVVREWGRLGVIGFGGPPSHIRLLRELCVERRQWIDAAELEDAIAACNLLPGPASTQLSIFCAWRVAGVAGGVVGGLAFIVPGLVLILALSALFVVGTPPRVVLGAGAGAGAAVAAVAVNAGTALVPQSWQRRRTAWRWVAYVAAGAAAAALVGPWLVLVLLACGVVELALSRATRPPTRVGSFATAPLLLTGTVGLAALPALVWTALKVGALSYGGGFVIIPLMQSDAVHHHWTTSAQFLNAVALGQVTPGPVVQTVAAVGYAAAGVGGGLLAAAVAFAPSFVFVLGGASRFGRLRANDAVAAFLRGAGPAAIGAILGSAVQLARALAEPWQVAVLAGATVLAVGLRRGPVLVLLVAAAVGVVVALTGGPLPS